MVQTINGIMKKVALPPNYEYEITGEEQKRQESFKSLWFALLLSLALVYMVLAAQFESLLHPFTVILSIPMAFVGAIAIFLIMGKTMNIMAYIGFIMLGGIAVNNAIVLVDRINQLKSDGLTLMDAVVMAGQQRIRPILMTSLTTILGLLPLTIGFGEGVSLRAPMALAVMGGLTTSTALTLIVIPCVYYIIDVLRQRIFKRTITV
jgi:HAE1 family hydrophobic/amphiphilic exporter-1